MYGMKFRLRFTCPLEFAQVNDIMILHCRQMLGPEIRVQEGQELVVPHPDAVSGLEEIESLQQGREDEVVPGDTVILALRCGVGVHMGI